VPLSRGGGGWSPSNTMWPGPRPTSVPSGILIHPAIWPRHGPKIGRELCPFFEGGLDPHLTQCDQGRVLPPCQVTSLSIHPFGHNRAYTNVTIRQHTTEQDRRRSDSIWRTVCWATVCNCTRAQQLLRWAIVTTIDMG